MSAKRVWALLTPPLLVIFVCRIYQMLTLTNSTLLEIICFSVCFLMFLVSSFVNFNNKNGDKSLKINKSLVVSALSILCAVFILIDSYYRLTNYIGADRDIMQLFIGIFGVLSGITFAITSINFYKGKNYFDSQKVATLFPCVWAVCRLLELFFVYNSVSYDPWQLTDEIAMMFLVLFFLNFAKSFAGIENDKKIKNLFLWGVPCITFIILYTSQFFVGAANVIARFKVCSISAALADLSIAPFVLSFLLNVKVKN